MTHPARPILLAGVFTTLALLVMATASDTARLGPVVFWAVHREELAGGSEVALRPGLGLPAPWPPALPVAALLSRRRDA